MAAPEASRPFATHLGSLPGENYPAAVGLVADSFEQLAVPELPARGVGAHLLGRTAALLSGLAVDLQPAGWRLTDHAGADQRRALALFRRDLDDLEERAHDRAGTAKLSVAGPWTLAAGLDLPRGELVIADRGAARELAASLGEGLSSLVGELRRRFPGLTWTLQLDEPSLPAVHAGSVATSSGYRRHRAVDEAVIGHHLRLVADAVTAAGATVALHSCAPGIDLEWLIRGGIDTVALDVGTLTDGDLDALSGWIEAGRTVWWGVQPTHQPDRVLGRDALLDGHRRLVRRLGIDPQLVASRSAFTPACGLAGWSAATVPQVFSNLTWLAETVDEDARQG
ncbi:methionine synthase [Aestuariimicrobium soli]|uniref:methionine synthase n=1 Tax=Aestuariimicrobium soli TaxID=2035834 RepID=UPI003EBE1C34